MDAPDGMTFKSAAGSVGITSLKDVTIKSMNGKVNISQLVRNSCPSAKSIYSTFC